KVSGTGVAWRARWRSAGVAQPRRDSVDGEVDGAAYARIGLAMAVALRGAPTADQFDLQVVQRVDVGKALAQRGQQHGVVGQQVALRQQPQHGYGARVFGADLPEDALAQRAPGHQLRVARRDGEIRLG